MLKEFRINDIVTDEAFNNHWQTLNTHPLSGRWAIKSGEGGFGPNMTAKNSYFSSVMPLLAKPGALFCIIGDGRDDDYTRLPPNVEYLPSPFNRWTNTHYYKRS